MAQLAPMMQLRARFEDKCGHPLAGGSVFAFEVGTSTPKDTFKDADGTIPNTHPIKLDYRGEADIYLLSGRYRFVVYSCHGVKIYDVDNVGEWLGPINAENVFDGNKNQHQINEEQAEKNIALSQEITDSVKNEQDRALLAETNLQTSISNESTRATDAEANLNLKIDSETQRAQAAEQSLQLQITTGNAGIKYFSTEAEVLAFTPGTQDPKQAYAFDTKKNYLWDAANSVWKDEGISAVNSAINVLSKVNSLLNLNSAIQANTFYHTLNGTTVVKDSNTGLFAVEADVSEGDYLILNSQSYPNIGAYFITDSSNAIIDTMGTNEILTQPYLVKIPANASKLYLNCVNEYADKFNISKIPTGYIELLYTGNDRQQFTYYTSSNGSPVTKNSNHGVFAVEMAVQEGDYYLIDTKGFGIAGEYYVTDEN
ncbi:hypothetical protein KWE47_03570, partial [Acinetobacter baumannii]